MSSESVNLHFKNFIKRVCTKYRMPNFRISKEARVLIDARLHDIAVQFTDSIPDVKTVTCGTISYMALKTFGYTPAYPFITENVVNSMALWFQSSNLLGETDTNETDDDKKHASKSKRAGLFLPTMPFRKLLRGSDKRRTNDLVMVAATAVVEGWLGWFMTQLSRNVHFQRRKTARDSDVEELLQGVYRAEGTVATFSELRKNKNKGQDGDADVDMADKPARKRKRKSRSSPANSKTTKKSRTKSSTSVSKKKVSKVKTRSARKQKV